MRFKEKPEKMVSRLKMELKNKRKVKIKQTRFLKKALFCSLIFHHFIFLWCLLCFSVKSQTPEENKKVADLALEKALKSYNSRSIQIEISQEVFLNYLKESLKTHGFLKKKKGEFRLELKGSPSSLILFDGHFLWYQADIREKVIFKFKKHPQIQLLTGLFSKKSFFEVFEITNFRKSKKSYIFHLTPRADIPGLKEVFIKVKSYISEVRIIWKDLNNWQKLKLSKPYHKEFPEKAFQMAEEGLQIISHP